MSTDRRVVIVNGLRIDVAQKDIKNLHLGVYPPNGRVRVAAPLHMSDDAIRLAVVGKLAWIRRQRENYVKQSRQSEREAVTGESHYLFGRRYLLCVVKSTGPERVVIRNKTKMELHVRPQATAEERLRVLDRWYRSQLRQLIASISSDWQATLGVKPTFIGIKRMKTKWGSCNTEEGRVWLNSELAKKPIACVEYIVVHELVHLIERSHTARFVKLMDRALPDWRSRRNQLKSSPLANETWDC
jgi:predicted metal-dependent hydrolase